MPGVATSAHVSVFDLEGSQATRNPGAKKKAIFAIAHTLIVIIWNVLATDSAYTDLGADFYVHRNDPDRQTRRLIAKLEALGHRVTIQPAA